MAEVPDDGVPAGETHVTLIELRCQSDRILVSVLFFESDNSVNTSPVDFTMNGVKEGTIGGKVPNEVSPTGYICPGG